MAGIWQGATAYTNKTLYHTQSSRQPGALLQKLLSLKQQANHTQYVRCKSTTSCQHEFILSHPSAHTPEEKMLEE